MVVFNGKKFAENEAEFSDIQQAGGVCSGFYMKVNAGVELFNVQNELIAFIRFHDNFLMSARVLDDGKRWYSFSSSQLENLLNINGILESRFFSREVVIQIRGDKLVESSNF
jgi:hypothetical protein